MPALNRPASCLITRGLATDADPASRQDVLAAVRLGVEHGVTMVQVREKQLSGGNLFELIRSAADIVRDSPTKLLVNDRADIAAAAGADGVHLRSDSMPAADVRAAFAGLLIGRSVHGYDEAEEAANDADFVFYGPVFATPGKGVPAGIDALRSVCEKAGSCPVIAIGGITADNAAEVLSAGAAGIAAIRAMNEPDSLSRIMTALKV